MLSKLLIIYAVWIIMYYTENMINRIIVYIVCTINLIIIDADYIINYSCCQYD